MPYSCVSCLGGDVQCWASTLQIPTIEALEHVHSRTHVAHDIVASRFWQVVPYCTAATSHLVGLCLWCPVGLLNFCPPGFLPLACRSWRRPSSAPARCRHLRSLPRCPWLTVAQTVASDIVVVAHERPPLERARDTWRLVASFTGPLCAGGAPRVVVPRAPESCMAGGPGRPIGRDALRASRMY